MTLQEKVSETLKGLQKVLDIISNESEELIIAGDSYTNIKTSRLNVAKGELASALMLLKALEQDTKEPDAEYISDLIDNITTISQDEDCTCDFLLYPKEVSNETVIVVETQANSCELHQRKELADKLKYELREKEYQTGHYWSCPQDEYCDCAFAGVERLLDNLTE